MQDAAADDKGFKEASNNSLEYQYDASGNMTRDDNKGIGIEYNHLNLPIKVTFDNGKEITWVYDAAGVKLYKISNDGSNTVRKDYLGGIEYADNTLEAVYHSEGRAVPNGSGDYQFEYTLKDHLGNARVTFSDLDKNGEVGASEILQTNHYYPFGMQHESVGIITGAENAYQYNGKELNSDFGLDWLDYGARWYDASIGRWSPVDPLAEDFYDWSGYNYVLNTPTNAIDPDGKDAIIIIDMKNSTIQVIQTFHISKENFNNEIKGVPFHPKEGKPRQITYNEFKTKLEDDYNSEWGSQKTVEVNGVVYDINYSLDIVEHETDTKRDAALIKDPTSNKIVLDKNLQNKKKAPLNGAWRSIRKERGIYLNPSSLLDGSFSHEAGHSMGVYGHKKRIR